MTISQRRWNKGKLFYVLLLFAVLFITLPLTLSAFISLETLKSSNLQSQKNQAMALESQIHYARLSNVAHSLSKEAENLRKRTKLLSDLSAEYDLSDDQELLEEAAAYLRSMTGDTAKRGKDYFLYFVKSNYLLGTREGLDAANYADPRIFTAIRNADPYDLQYAKTQFGPDDDASYLSSFVYTVYPGVLYIYMRSFDPGARPGVELSQDLVQQLNGVEMAYYDSFGSRHAVSEEQTLCALYDYAGLPGESESVQSFSFVHAGRKYLCFYLYNIENATKLAVFCADAIGERQTLISNLLIAGMLIAFLLLSILAFFLIRYVYTPIDTLVTRLQTEPQGVVRDDCRILNDALEGMDNKLREQDGKIIVMRDWQLKKMIQDTVHETITRTTLDNLTADTATSETETDMAKRLRQRATVGDKSLWITGETQQDLFNAYLQHAIDAGIVVPAGEAQQPKAPEKDVLFETRAWQWYNLYKVGKVRLTTLANYELYLKKHLIPYFGQCDIRTITIDQVQEFLNSKAGYSRKMIDELWLTLGMVLNAAVEDGLLSINPAKSKRLRNPSTKKTIREALTSAEADDIEAHLKDIPKLRDRRYVAMLLKFPARCEDIRGLQIKDFNFEEKTVTITKGVTYAKGHTIIGDPKTPAGKRKMLILPGLLEVLELSQEELNDPETYILASLGDPAPLTYQADKRLWERVKKAINVYGKTPHCFRHTFATRAHRAGVDDKTLQSMGGWKDLSTMKNIYIHTQQEDLEIARAQLTAV